VGLLLYVILGGQCYVLISFICILYVCDVWCCEIKLLCLTKFHLVLLCTEHVFHKGSAVVSMHAMRAYAGVGVQSMH
jgi:hypothetical protein